MASRDRKGRFTRSRAALDRFLDKCRFNAVTGCVEWVGGKTRGRGKTSWYGSFWYEGKPWKAHRWAARFLHGLEIDGLEVDHECGNTLCVHHLQAVTGQVNREWYWIRVEVGLIEEEPDDGPEDDGIPFFTCPDWFAATYSRAFPPSDEPPF